MMADKLYDGAAAFKKLENIRYKFILGRKAQLTELYITFDSIHFHHLAGLLEPLMTEVTRFRKGRHRRVMRGSKRKLGINNILLISSSSSLVSSP